MLTTASVAVSCAEWDDHYGNNAGSSGKNLLETLAADQQVSHFASLVKASDYGNLLSSSQSFTVFAPSNEALQGFVDSNPDSVKRMVENHIARYSLPSSTSPLQSVRMYNGKVYHFDSTSSFSGRTLISKDETATNGLLHVLSARIPFAYNLYEYIQSEPSLSKLYTFLHQFDETKVDIDNSVETGIDDMGRPTYDTVWVNYNRLLEDIQYGLGHINDEDSIYTMLMPTNEAWQAAYDRISPYYIMYDADSQRADSIRNVRTGIAIVSDLVYRGEHSAPLGVDTIVSTTGSIIHKPNTLIESAKKMKASNGVAYITDHLGYDNTETWNKQISIEAEEQNGRSYNNTLTSVYTRTVSSQSQIDGVSGDSYIEVQPISTATNPSVVFEIPNVLAGEYDVYAIFLPKTADGEAVEADSTCIAFSLAYQNDRGRIQTKTNRSKTLLTSGTEIVKMLAFEKFSFPVSDYTDRITLIDSETGSNPTQATTQLTISTNVTTSEFTSKKLSRTFRLDRIILEPIRK